MAIPSRMMLSSKMEAAQSLLSKALLTSLDISSEGVVTPSSTPEPLSQVVSKHTGSCGSICFVVRRPGWVLCREHGKQLTDLANNSDTNKLMEGFELFGNVKEIGVDDEGLSKFYNSYFRYPLYKDDDLVTYNDFFGKRKIKLTTYNPFKLYKGYKEMNKRLADKKIEKNMKGEGMVQGGLIIFDKAGKARYAYEEEIGSELVMEDIITALKELQSEK